MFEDIKQIELPEDIFHLIRDMIYKECGVVLNEEAKFFIENRLQQSVRRRNFNNFRDYYYFLKYDRKKGEELANVVDLLTIHETYFFRESQQLETFSEEILPEIHKRNSESRSLRIWSAGCSTGEEAYTLSMILNEKPEFRDWKVEIIGTDISQRVLHSARRGLYQTSAFRSMDPRYLSKYFRKDPDGYRIIDEIKKSVVFLHMNLFDEGKTMLISTMDVIFCRNVIIYFDLQGKQRVIQSFYHKLADEGFLLLGHSESLLHISAAFAIRHFKHDLLYQKKAMPSGGPFK
jgi:chemotaxis protein methyltransferase CheR